MTLLCYGIVLNEGRGGLGGGEVILTKHLEKTSNGPVYICMLCACVCSCIEPVIVLLQYWTITHTHTLTCTHTHMCTHAHTSITHTPNIIV